MRTKHAYITIAFLLGCSTTAFAQVGNCTSPVGEAFLDVNNVRARILNNGGLFRRGSPNVYTVPKDDEANAVFAGVIIVGGLVDGDLRTSAARYHNYEFWSGPLDEAGNPPADCSVFDRIWKVDRHDVVQFENGGSATGDLTEWPTGLGAPTLAADGSKIDVINQPLSQRVARVIDLHGGERPDFTGDQMLWWIMNDRGNEHASTKTRPIGLEVHATAFAFDSTGPPGADATFYRYRVFNRNSMPFEDAYFGLFFDADLGYFRDDYVGSDITLNLGFTYNADNEDEGGYGLAPPAIGTSFVRGAVIPVDGDSAIVKGKWKTGFTDLGLAAFMSYFDGAVLNVHPDAGIEYYRYMQARRKDGRQMMVGGDGFFYATTSTPTNFIFSGDPVAKEYWSEFNVDDTGRSSRPSDRHYYATTGPFTMKTGDEQEIIIAIPWARGTSNLDSVDKLRVAARAAKRFSDRDFDLSFEIVDSPQVSAVPSDRAVHIHWTNGLGSNNYEDNYRRQPPFAIDPYEFQGYRVYQYESQVDSVGRVIATYDIVDGLTKIIEGPRGELTTLAADGADTGLRHEHFVDGLVNYRTYYFGVQPYATKNDFYPRVLSGAHSRVEVTPTGIGDIGIVPNPYKLASHYERTLSAGEVRFTNVPTGAVVTIFALNGTQVRVLNHDVDGVLTWDLRNSAGREIGGGMYLVHVETQDLGTRVLKFGVTLGVPN